MACQCNDVGARRDFLRSSQALRDDDVLSLLGDWTKAGSFFHFCLLPFTSLRQTCVESHRHPGSRRLHYNYVGFSKCCK